MAKKTLILATRQSPLALWQAEAVKKQLETAHPGLNVTLLGLTTTADRLPGPLHHSGGKGLFVKELEEALLAGKADIAVHSMKDVPVNLPDGLCLPVMCARENPQDALAAMTPVLPATLPAGTAVGTGSPRRECQLLAAHPHLSVAPLRGNVQTRLKRLGDKGLQAIILATAGLIRLGLTQYIQHVFSLDDMLPAAGQGALGIECRADDAATAALISPLNHPPTLTAVTAERSLCRALQAGCHTPVAAFADIRADQLTLRARVGSLDGKMLLQTHVSGQAHEAISLGEAAAEKLLAQGAGKLLEQCI